MGNISDKAILILAGNLNFHLSYLITTVHVYCIRNIKSIEFLNNT